MNISDAAKVSALSGQAVGNASADVAREKTTEMRAKEESARAVAQSDKPSSARLPVHLGQNVNTTA